MTSKSEKSTVRRTAIIGSHSRRGIFKSGKAKREAEVTYLKDVLEQEVAKQPKEVQEQYR